MSFGIAVGLSKDEGCKHPLVWIAFRDGAGVEVSPDTARMVSAQLLLAADRLEKSNEGTEEE